MLADERDFLNYLKTLDMDFDFVGEYQVPQMQPVEIDLQNIDLIGFNYCTQKKFADRDNDTLNQKPKDLFVHLFLPDTYIERVWKRPEYYTEIFKRFDGIVQPDFSEYILMPESMKIFQHYRRQWLGSYMQKNGIVVIPAPCWSDEKSFHY